MTRPTGHGPDEPEALVEAVIEDARWQALDLAAVAERAARAALAAAGIDPEGCEISLLGADDARMATLNAAWRGKAGATNVLSWPSDEAPAPGAPRFLGDVALGWETCLREAEAAGIAPADHVTHLVAHAVLHLVGYDHEADDDAEAMEAMETKILATLGAPDPYRR